MIETDTSLFERWVSEAVERGLISNGTFSVEVATRSEDLLYPSSIHKEKGSFYAIAKVNSDERRILVIVGDVAGVFAGVKIEKGSSIITFCPLSHQNADALRALFPRTRPSPLGKNCVSFGVGDRLGIASPGHLRLFKQYNALPVLAQQSVRELSLTGRTYADVVDSATWAVFQENFTDPWGADGDHLKEEEWVETALSHGCTMITADLSEHLHEEYIDMSPESVLEAFDLLDENEKIKYKTNYLEMEVSLEGAGISFNPALLAKIVLTYKDAVTHAERLYKTGKSIRDHFDFEVSIDETSTTTLPEAHFFIAQELTGKGVDMTSLAPRFVGEFQKGIDYLGEGEDFAADLERHVVVANHFGYRISIHSGSDKFKIFPEIGKQLGEKFHIKTSGTNWLKALEVVCRENPRLYRKIHAYAHEVFPVARTYYYITPDMDALTDIENMADADLVKIFGNPADRQILHVSYGEVFKKESLKSELFSFLNENREKYWKALQEHIGNHLDSLLVAKK